MDDTTTEPVSTPRRGIPRPWIIAAIVLLLIGGGVAADEIADRYFIVRNWGVVEEGGLYRSGQISRHLIKDTLADHGIDLIVFLSIDKPNRPDVQAEQQAAGELNIPRKLYDLHGDGTGEITLYADAIAEVAKARRDGKQVLVHCHAGAQRTGVFVAAYRMLVTGATPEQAKEELFDGGHDPDSNPNLIPYLTGNMRRLAELLVERGVIERVPEPLPMLPT